MVCTQQPWTRCLLKHKYSAKPQSSRFHVVNLKQFTFILVKLNEKDRNKVKTLRAKKKKKHTEIVAGGYGQYAQSNVDILVL